MTSSVDKRLAASHWKIGTTRIESLKAMAYEGLDDVVSYDEPCSDIWIHQDGPLAWLTNWLLGKNYRNWCRVVIGNEELIAYEYELEGNFGVFRVPLEEIVDVAHSNDTVTIIGNDGHSLELICNCDTESLSRSIRSNARRFAENPMATAGA